MMLRVISIVFLFLVHLRFPSNLSTIEAIRNRYGNDTFKLVGQFAKFDNNVCHLLLLNAIFAIRVKEPALILIHLGMLNTTSYNYFYFLCIFEINRMDQFS